MISASQMLHLPELKAPLQTTTYSRLQADALSFTSNQASLAIFTKPAFGVYGERKFLLQELSSFAASAVLPTNSGNFGFTARRYGSSDYNETEAGLAYGRKLGSKASVGAQFNYRSFKTRGYGHAGALTMDVGAIFQFSDEMRGGFHVYRPAEILQGGKADLKLASVYEIGFGYDASDQLFLTAIVNKVEGAGVQATAALQYAFARSLLCKAGISSGSSSFYLGAGVELKDFRFDVITSFQQNLGFSPGIQLLYRLPDQ